MINWMGGWPKASLLSGTAWEERLSGVVASVRQGRLPPGIAGNEAEIRARLQARLGERVLGAASGLSVLALTSGADESLSRLLLALTGPGDTVLVDRLVARPALHMFRRMSVRVSAVPGDERGMDPEALLLALIREKPALVYAAPACPDPSGRSWDDERRRALVNLCEWSGVPLVRDDRQAALASASGAFDPQRDGGTAVYSIGQLPPGLFPGLRLGWIASAAPGARPDTARDAAQDTATATGATPNLSSGPLPRFDRLPAGRKAALLEAAVHEVALRWLEDPQSAEHLGAFRERCRARLRLFLRAMAGANIRGCHWIEPDGGMHVWIRLPGGLEGEALLRTAWRKGLLFQPGSGFFAARPERNAIRVTPVHTAEERLAEGVRRLGETVAELTGRWAGI